MGEKKRGLVWLWVLLGIGALGAVGYGWYNHSQPETGEELVAVEVSTFEKPSGKTSSGITSNAENMPEDQASVQSITQKVPDADSFDKENEGEPPATGELVEYQFEPREKEPLSKTASGGKVLEKTSDDPETAYCILVNRYVQEFFEYLEKKEYIHHLNLGETAYARFKQTIKRLGARPPIPAGEGVDPAIMIKNIYFFCRALDKKDLRLINRVVTDDPDTLEDNMGMFYQWLMLGKRCRNPGDVRPSFDTLYRYAGFFLNTTGGRAYMFRRDLKLRLLVTYYSVQIIYQADKAGKNSYGINVLPYLTPLMEEMTHYPDLQYKERYLNTLAQIQMFYPNRR